ncbi:hypothetical protein [Microscilla marina]|uniref:Uncharacterized protein n=1 Tax=Microscilla marina ATCC 23134 TaxID=313606 RepID=A1ZSE6_MICM2|nr:hypothetical protein [Microscilla marina]EAY26694.1 hypothetical protein M23134_02945 [Microscilla marina ATCC 23134]
MKIFSRNLLKWKLVYQSLPFAVGILLIKIGLVYFFNINGFFEIQEMRLVFTSGVFLIGFMLAGTLADYKESERIPGEIATALETIEETSVALAIKTNTSIKSVRWQVLEMSQMIYEWLYRKHSEQDVHQTLTEYNQTIHALEAAGGAPPIIGRLLIRLGDLRQLVTRTNVISKTGFLSTGYALLELLIVIVSVLLLLLHFQSTVSEIAIILVIELIYVYMYKLIVDIDDPFEYEEGKAQGAAEVTLFPIENYINRLNQRLEAEEPQRARKTVSQGSGVGT